MSESLITRLISEAQSHHMSISDYIYLRYSDEEIARMETMVEDEIDTYIGTMETDDFGSLLSDDLGTEPSPDEFNPQVEAILDHIVNRSDRNHMSISQYISEMYNSEELMQLDDLVESTLLVPA